MKGKLVVSAIAVDSGYREKLVEVENTILNGMYTKLLLLLGAGTGASPVTRMQFGTGTLTPASSQTFLQKAINPVKTVSPTVDAGNFEVEFSAALLADEGNGFPIAEAGLVCADDTLVARATFDVRTKTSSYIFDFSWTVTLKS